MQIHLVILIQRSYTVEITDGSTPYVDCHSCQDSVTIPGHIKVCHGGAGSTFDVGELLYEDYQLSVDDYSLNDRKDTAVFNTQLPGSIVDLSDTAYNQPTMPTLMYLDCNCALHPVDQRQPQSYVTNSWNSWGTYFTFDNADGVISNTPSMVDPNADGDYDITYTATDAAGNSGTCTINVIYDILILIVLSNFYAAPEIDVNDKNYSVVASYDEASFNKAFGISGEKTAYLDPARNDGDAYHVGYARNISHTSTYYLEDNAGNTATCSWEVFAINTTPCIYPVCDDLPPVVHNCPTSQSYDCTANSNCGCGSFTPPTFTDDKFVKTIDVYVNGTLHETYDNTQTSTVQDLELEIGITTITYVAKDMHDYNATCEFTITYTDTEAPVFSECPSSEIINVPDGNTYSYDYTVAASDVCILNDDVFYDVVGFPLTDEHDAGNEVLNVNTNTTFTYDIADSSGNINTCQWWVNVVDTGNPTVTCPDDITQRVTQGESSTVITFSHSATDTGDASPNTAFATYPSGSDLTPGVHTNLIVATDHSGLTDASIYCYHFRTISISCI